MDDVVVDASVFVSRLVRTDAHHPTTTRWFERHGDGSNLLVVPAVMPAEVAGAIARRTKDGTLARRAVDRLLRLPFLRVVAVDRTLGLQAANLAADLGLRGTDAMYVAVAERLGLPLVTWDREQRERAATIVSTRTADA